MPLLTYAAALSMIAKTLIYYYGIFSFFLPPHLLYIKPFVLVASIHFFFVKGEGRKKQKMKEFVYCYDILCIFVNESFPAGRFPILVSCLGAVRSMASVNIVLLFKPRVNLEHK